jgi:hypothetical protein
MEAMRFLSALIAAALLAVPGAVFAQEKAARVAVPVADLRKDPAPPGSARAHDPIEESQLLYAERVLVLEEDAGWTRVQAVEQSEWSHSRQWEGYPGWVRSSDLLPDPEGGWSANLIVRAKKGAILDPDGKLLFSVSMGTGLMGSRQANGWSVRLLDGRTGWISEEEVASRSDLRKLGRDLPALRKRIVESARLMIGDPYYWGGRSAHDPEAKEPPYTGVDCSGLTGLAYQTNGIMIPRDAHEQWMRAKPVPLEDLQPGDLVFLCDPQDPKKITHVMLYAGENRVIEGPGTGSPVQEASLARRLSETGERRPVGGSYLE